MASFNVLFLLKALFKKETTFGRRNQYSYKLKKKISQSLWQIYQIIVYTSHHFLEAILINCKLVFSAVTQKIGVGNSLRVTNEERKEIHDENESSKNNIYMCSWGKYFPNEIMNKYPKKVLIY